MKFDLKKALKEIGNYLWEPIKEIFLFIFYSPIYISLFLKGLRIFSKSYREIIKGLEDRQKAFQGDNLKGLKGHPDTAEILSNNWKEIIRLMREQEKMFNQLFSSFIALLALIVSICVLIFSLKK